eukprot:2708357-Lingulodinium_polyedra.AAC.1
MRQRHTGRQPAGTHLRRRRRNMHKRHRPQVARHTRQARTVAGTRRPALGATPRWGKGGYPSNFA